MHRVRLLSVLVEDKLGALAKITRVLRDAEVSIRWITIVAGERFGAIEILVDRTETAQAALTDHGYTVSLHEVLAAEVEDKPGALARVAEVLERHRLNVAGASGFIVDPGKRAILLLDLTDLEGARAVLEVSRVRLLTEEELVRL